MKCTITAVLLREKMSVSMPESGVSEMDPGRFCDAEMIFVNSRRFPRYYRSCRHYVVTRIDRRRRREVAIDTVWFLLPRKRVYDTPVVAETKNASATQRKKQGLSADGHARTQKRELSERSSVRKRQRTTNHKLPSIGKAAAENQLFHSVLQTGLCVEEFNDGADSDGGEIVDQDWRLELANDQLSEYVDMLSVEKLFMNLWNQFLLREYSVRSDRQVAVACHIFAKSKFQTTLPNDKRTASSKRLLVYLQYCFC